MVAPNALSMSASLDKSFWNAWIAAAPHVVKLPLMRRHKHHRSSPDISKCRRMCYASALCISCFYLICRGKR